jgi:hypothetical protein
LAGISSANYEDPSSNAQLRNLLLGHYKADNDFSASWRGSETQIKLFYEFERRKELVVVL